LRAFTLCPNRAYSDPTYIPGAECLPTTPYWAQIVTIEIIATFIFVSFILSVKRINGSNIRIINASIVSLSLFVIINQVGALSGACLNPAVGLAQSIY